ncbi:phosphatase PAP2 family protein [Alteribacter populi]|uniref:phosphatase PAP2 family protein n=1 Tax=Alteribacter populi TaxID=2011011 RepID=UPI000BBAA05E|nr:phosphatase PAP2 family protein [Alteribacter populi]
MRHRKLLLIMLVSFFIFAITTWVQFTYGSFLFDEVIISGVTQVSHPFLIQMMQWVTLLGSGEFIVVITLIVTLILLYNKDWFNSIFLCALTFGGIVLNFLLKVLFQRERPGEARELELFSYSLEIPSYSFPSGHTMRSVLLMAFLIYLSYVLIKRSSIRFVCYFLCTIVIMLIAMSRIYLGLHYPSDIVAAMSISLTWFCICFYFLSKTNLKNTLTNT